MASKLQAREEGGEEGESEELNVDKEKPVENLAADPGDGASSLLEACTLSPGPEAPLDHASEQKSPEELVVARAATHGMHWRPGHIQYRNSILRWSLLQRAASIRVREGGSLSSVHLETSVECSSQLSGTPVLSCTFTGAHFMAENGRFHDCVSERRPSAEHGNLSIYAIPPDGNFELVRYTSEAQVPLAVAHTGDHYAGDALVSGNDSNALAVLTQTRLPIAVFAFSNEKQEGRLFDLHVRMRITEEYTLLRQVRCIVPLHPNCRPGSVRITASLGRAQVEWVGDGKATGKHHSVVSWEIETVGTLTGHTEEHERIECNQEATLDIECAIAAPFIVFPHHVITGEENRPACVPEDSLREDRGLWQQWNDIIKNLHKLDEQKKPFPRDRTSSKLQQRQHIEQLKHLAESRLVSSCLSRALPPISVRIEKIFGPCFSGLDVVNSSVLSTPYSNAMTVGDDGLEGVDGPMLRPLVFAHGTSNELTSDNFLFDVYRSDFRKKNQDFDVPLPVMELEVEEESPPIHTKGDETTSEEPDAATSADQEKEKSVDKVEEKKPPAKGGASKGSAAKGGAAKGGASKGKLSGVKKKR